MTRVNIELPEDLHRKVKIICALQGKTLKEYLILSLEEKLSKEKTKLEEVIKHGK